MPSPITSYTDLLFILFGALSVWNYSFLFPKDSPVDVPNDWIRMTYDFIIVGGGSAGSVVANRLSENKDWSVLLLEAGGHETVETEVPVLMYNLWRTHLDWNYTTVRQQRACGVHKGLCVWPRGYVLGGSSTTNAMVYMRGNKKDYDNWAAMGIKGWSYDEVLPYFKKSEDQQNPKYASDKKYHSTGGYLTVGDSRYKSPFIEDYMNLGRRLGYEVRDVNGQNQTGFMPLQGTFREGARCSTAKAFLRPARNRPNLHVTTGAFVTKIIIDEKTKTALGVKFVKDGKERTVMAAKEVVVSGGSINSPHLLMLSGIGPKKYLSSVGIPVIKDLPVGENLQDHIGVVVKFRTTEKVKDFWNREAVVEYATSRSGPMSSSTVDAIGFLHSKYSTDRDYPDIQMDLISPQTISMGETKTWAFFGLVLRPKVRGTIRPVSADPRVHPAIDPNYFGVPEDLLLMKEAARTALQFGASPEMNARLKSEFDFDYYEACSHLPAELTDAFVDCLVHNYTFTDFHPTGTCRMGAGNDPRTVVDPFLRVVGVNRLRVIDASVMPDVPSGNTNAPTIMVAEKGADIIKAYWKMYFPFFSL